MFVRTDDAKRDAGAYFDQRDERLSHLPKCGHCGEPIQEDECYKLDGELIHTDCLYEYCDKIFKVHTDNYID